MSIANQEAIEQFISMVNDAREALNAADKHTSKSVPQAWTSPEDHYHIVASTWNSHDLTAWLGDKVDDPAVEVCLEFSFNFITYFLWIRISFHVSKTTCLGDYVALSITEMSMTSWTKTRVVFSYTTIKFSNMCSSESTIQHMISTVNRILSTPGYEPTSCYSHKSMNILIHIGMPGCA